MTIDNTLILDHAQLTELQHERLVEMQAEYDIQHPDNTITLKAIKVDGYVCIAKFTDFDDMTSDIVTPLREDGTRYPIQYVKLSLTFMY